MPKVVIASRKSDLARIQAQSVAEALRRVHSDLEIQLVYRESLGDKNQHDPLWKMPEKGVFTQDFREDLLAERIDIVVHSWKDLPTQMPDDTMIVGALPRADQRDLLLVKKSALSTGLDDKNLKILSSSPRRSHNLTQILSALLPSSLEAEKVQFLDIRGNVPTRVQKCLADASAHGLVLAKAGVDRLLSATAEEFQPMRLQLLDALKQFRWMVLPLSANPTAAAQGALALEIKTTRKDLLSYLEPLVCKNTTEQVCAERVILKNYGGGCHQKIGVSVIDHPLGALVSIKGLTDQGRVLDAFATLQDYVAREEISNVSLSQNDSRSLSWAGESFDDRQLSAVKKQSYFPTSKEKPLQIFDRKTFDVDMERLRLKPLMISRISALPEAYQQGADQILWCAGLETWRAMAKRGYWVSGTFDSLGETTDGVPSLTASIGALAPEQVHQFVKLTHESSEPHANTVFTYALAPRSDATIPTPVPDWIYWMSGSAFLWALANYPEIKNSLHSCGPGNTLQTILSRVPAENVRVYPNFQCWLSNVQRFAESGRNSK